MQAKVEEAIAEIGKVVLGKNKQIQLALGCLFAGGHLLLEDKPGMGKTTLSQSLARVFGLNYSRIQFTSDLLPADILGVSVYDQNTAQFTFHRGQFSTIWCWLMKSIVLPPKPKAHCWKPWKKAR